MPLLFVRNDITKMQVDAIVNAANHTLLGGGGVDGCIHRAAGPELLAECRTLGGCAVGDAKSTLGYNLPSKYVIHTVGPVWKNGKHEEEALLTSCYIRSLELADEKGCQSVAFPLISSGAYGYPKDAAIQVAVRTIKAFLNTHEMTVYLVLFDRLSTRETKQKYGQIQEFISDHYVEDMHKRALLSESSFMSDEARRNIRGRMSRRYEEIYLPEEERAEQEAQCCSLMSENSEIESFDLTLEEMLNQVDESFSDMLIRMIDEKGMTDAQCYKKANIDRKLFSKIRSNPQYRPSKSTAIAFAIALELTLPETKDLLLKAGYALSHSSKFDLIIEYFILQKQYDVFMINETLFSFDQKILGA